jgi:hypothetical protein
MGNIIVNVAVSVSNIVGNSVDYLWIETYLAST